MKPAGSLEYNEAMRAWVHDDFVERFYNTFREQPDRFMTVMRLVRDLRPETINDFACSWGLFGALFRWQRGFAPSHITGIDFAGDALTFAKRYGQYDTVIEADLTQPVQVAPADLCLCMEVLEHVTSPEAVLRNVRAGCKKYAFFSCPVEEDIDGLFHIRQVSADDLAAWTLAAGFFPMRGWFQESEFNEKPHWKGWNFLLCGI